MTSLCVKFQPSSTLPSDRFWWGVLVLLVLVLLVLVLLVVTGVKQSQLIVYLAWSLTKTKKTWNAWWSVESEKTQIEPTDFETISENQQTSDIPPINLIVQPSKGWRFTKRSWKTSINRLCNIQTTKSKRRKQQQPQKETLDLKFF